MKQGERFPPVDAQELMRIFASGAQLEERVIYWLEARYDAVWKEGHQEGHQEGRLAQMTGCASANPRSPYR